MEPKDLDLSISVPVAEATGDAVIAERLGRAVPRRGANVVIQQGLPAETRARLHESLQSALADELARQGDTLGLAPGDEVAISSSVGQSISF